MEETKKEFTPRPERAERPQRGRTPQSKQFVFYNQGYAKRRFRKKAALFCTLVSRLRQTKRTPDASFFRYSCVQFIRSSSL